MSPSERKQELIALARRLAEQARQEAEWFTARALTCEAIGQSIERSEDPAHWEREYRSMAGEWALELDAAAQEAAQ